jgi:HAMP domain-containing protein
MKIMAKFNAVLVSVFLVGLLLAGFTSHNLLHSNARDEVIKHAGMMMEAALAIRGYTVREIKPLLAAQLEREFLPQSVPAYAATENFHALQKKNPEYMYKEASLNPTNPREKATYWESYIIMQFRNNPKVKQIVGERETPTGPSLYLARPIQITNEGCLTCHSTIDRAPATMIKLYGTANGFGWKHNEIVGSQIISVPLSLPLAKAKQASITFMASLVAIFAALFVLINLMLRRMILQPVNAMAEIADKVSKGKLDVPEFATDGKDEIAALSQSFNRMRVSLEKAMKMLSD